MNADTIPAQYPKSLFFSLAVLAGAAAVAAASARPYAGAWSDGSRLATVEALVDQHTLAIDQSIFVKVPAANGPTAGLPYPGDEVGLLEQGTGDKLFIGGHYYSDKSPVPAVLMAGLYGVLQWCTGLTARQQPAQFCYWMTLATSGLAYTLAVWCMFRLGGSLRLPRSCRLLLTGSFALTTVALPYTRHVNNHILLLAVTAALTLGLTRLAGEGDGRGARWGRLTGLGTLAGLGYTIDLGAGPVLFLSVLPLIVYRCRSLRPVVLVTLAALPWLLLHHAINYAVGGTFKPANAVPEYLNWPGGTFNARNMTGSLNHSLGHFIEYASALLGGKRGFLGHNLPLFLALPATVLLLRRRVAELPEILFTCSWCGGVWLVYALSSVNYSGQCCSVRWFVPTLAGGYYILSVFLQRYPAYRPDLVVLSAWGLVLAGLMWWEGPWIKHLVPLFWPIQGAALGSWMVYRYRQHRRQKGMGLTATCAAPHLADAA